MNKDILFEDLSYRQFALIREALKEKREKVWEETVGCFIIKGTPFEKIKEAKAQFKSSTNLLTDKGNLNFLLKKVEEFEEYLQEALK